MIKLSNGEWTWPDTDYNLHGQHYKMYGSMGFVHYYLIDKEIFDIRTKQQERKNLQ